MSSKCDEKYSDEREEVCSYGKFDGGKDGEDNYYDDSGSAKSCPPPRIEVLNIETNEDVTRLTDSLELKISFSLDTDVVCAYWVIKLLVDSADARLIKILGETAPEDYPEGDSEMYFSV